MSKCTCAKCDPIIKLRLQRNMAKLKQAIQLLCIEIIHIERIETAEALQKRAEAYKVEIDSLQSLLNLGHAEKMH